MISEALRRHYRFTAMTRISLTNAPGDSDSGLPRPRAQSESRRDRTESLTEYKFVRLLY